MVGQKQFREVWISTNKICYNPQRKTMISEMVSKGFRYNRNNGPLTSWEIAVTQGVNCQWVVHEFYREQLGIELPKDLLSRELFQDSKFFVTIDPSEEELRMGDILIVSRTPQARPERFHLAVCIDSQSVVHATSFDQKVSIWSTSELFERYPLVRAAKRMKPEALKT